MQSRFRKPGSITGRQLCSKINRKYDVIDKTKVKIAITIRTYHQCFSIFHETPLDTTYLILKPSTPKKIKDCDSLLTMTTSLIISTSNKHRHKKRQIYKLNKQMNMKQAYNNLNQEQQILEPYSTTQTNKVIGKKNRKEAMK